VKNSIPMKFYADVSGALRSHRWRWDLIEYYTGTSKKASGHRNNDQFVRRGLYYYRMYKTYLQKLL
jgi:hypothetical protein